MKRRELTLPETVKVSDATEVRHVTAPSECDLSGLRMLTADQRADACEEQIRQLAYQKWEQAGCPSGDGFDFWLDAERDILGSAETA